MIQHNNRQSLVHAGILLGVAIIAYWQIAFMTNCLKWDMIDVVLPFRYWIGECWQNGIFPFWNPYQLGGTPISPDMQYPVFYPETYIVGFLFGYTNITLQLLFVLYIFLAGYGMYRLSRHFGTSPQAGLPVGMAYMLSGFFTGHGQAMFAIVSAAWIPYVLLFYLKMIKHRKIRDALATSLFMFLLITNGYQTFSIISGYFLLFIAAVYVIYLIKNRNYIAVKKLVGLNLLFLVLTILLCSPLIISLIQVSAYTSRLGFLPLSLALQNPLSPQSLLSWLIPFATVKNPEFFNTDMSMANAYFGLVMLAFLVLSLFRNKNRLEWIFLSWAVFCLLASFGEYTPLRAFLYHYFPLMDLFRAPSYFSLFSIIGFLLLAGNSLSDFTLTNKRQTGVLRMLIVLFALFLLVIVIYSFPKIYFRQSAFQHLFSDFYASIQKTTFYEHLFLHSLVQLFFSGLLYYFLFIKKQFSFKLLSIIIFMEMFVSVQLNTYYTVASHKSPKELKANLQALPKGFPLPGSNPVIKNSDISGAFLPVWRNTHIFHKTISFDGFSSFVFDNFARLVDDYPRLKNAVFSNPPAYLSAQVLPLSQLNDTFSADSTIVFVADSFYNSHKKLFVSKNYNEPEDSVYFTQFSPVNFQLEVISTRPQMLNLIQSNYTGWSATVNGVRKPVLTANLLFMSVEVPKGKSTVVFQYQNKTVLVAFIFSTCILIILSLFLVLSCKKITE